MDASVRVGVAVRVCEGVTVAVDVEVAVGFTVEVFVGVGDRVLVAVAVDVWVGANVEVDVVVAVDVITGPLPVWTTSCGAAVPSREEKVTPSVLSATRANV